MCPRNEPARVWNSLTLATLGGFACGGSMAAPLPLALLAVAAGIVAMLCAGRRVDGSLASFAALARDRDEIAEELFAAYSEATAARQELGRELRHAGAWLDKIKNSHRTN